MKAQLRISRVIGSIVLIVLIISGLIIIPVDVNATEMEFLWPVKNHYLTGSWNEWRTTPDPGHVHYGIDMVSLSGDLNIYAAQDGTVTKAEWINGYGYSIVIDHGNSRWTLYAHLASMTVKSGKVRAGQKIGVMGNTGGNYAVHLHFNIYTKNPLLIWNKTISDHSEHYECKCSYAVKMKHAREVTIDPTTVCKDRLSTIQTYTIKYNANGGTGSMNNQPVTYGTGVNLYKNNFTRVGYEFIGWNAQRSDGSWNSHGPNKEQWGWYTKAKLPSGWVVATWNDGGRISGKDATKDKEIINCYAQWRPITYTIRYNSNGGTGSMEDQTITYGTGVNLYKNNFTREGYEFIGWKPQRVSDGRWNSHGPNKEKWDWCIEEELPSGWQIATWNDGGRISGKDAFIKGDIVNCYAQWKEVEHIWDEGVITEEAKCEVGGVRTYICKNCGETKTESIGATGHKWDSGKITKNVPCDEESEKTYTCNNCGKTRTEIIAATNHTWDSGKITKNVTCEEDGVKTYTCGNCGDTKTESIVATGHSFDSGKITKKVTCEEDGVKTYTCGNCGETKSEKMAATGHSFDSGKITKKVTCEEDGVKTYTCGNCGETKTEKIAAIGHSWDSGKITQKASCEEDGVKTFTCSNCKETKTERIVAMGHKWDGGTISTEATIAVEGEKTYTCTICKDTKTELIPRIEIAGIPGDVNMDTKVNFQDVTTLLKHVKKKPLDKVDLKAVDVDGNGKINFQDVTVLLKYVKKKLNTIYYDDKSYTR